MSAISRGPPPTEMAVAASVAVSTAYTKTRLHQALGTQAPTTCPAADGDGDGRVTINDLVTAVNYAVNGCR